MPAHDEIQRTRKEAPVGKTVHGMNLAAIQFKPPFANRSICLNSVLIFMQGDKFVEEDRFVLGDLDISKLEGPPIHEEDSMPLRMGVEFDRFFV